MRKNKYELKIDNNFILEYSYGESILNGSFEIYEKAPLDPDNIIRITGTYKDGELNGICNFIVGTKKAKKCHYRKGKLSGVCEEYGKGKILERYFYKKGILDGNYEIYDTDGNTKIRFNYVNGFSDGLYTSYDKNGKILSEGIFSEIENINIEKNFYSNGNLKEVKMKYSSGPYEKYYLNGKLKIRSTLNRNGEFQNSYEEYYETGEIKIKCNYKNGRKVGLYREYDITGKIVDEGLYGYEVFSDNKLFNDGNFGVELLSTQLRAAPLEIMIEIMTPTYIMIEEVYSELASLK